MGEADHWEEPSGCIAGCLLKCDFDTKKQLFCNLVSEVSHCPSQILSVCTILVRGGILQSLSCKTRLGDFMIRIYPFTALRPSFEDASEVSSDPYDVISTSEARERAAGKPKSFLHVVRSEIDFPVDTDCHVPEVYEKASDNLQGMIVDGVLQRESQPSIYLYRQVREGIAQVGVVGLSGPGLAADPGPQNI